MLGFLASRSPSLFALPDGWDLGAALLGTAVRHATWYDWLAVVALAAFLLPFVLPASAEDRLPPWAYGIVTVDLPVAAVVLFLVGIIAAEIW